GFRFFVSLAGRGESNRCRINPRGQSCGRRIPSRCALEAGQLLLRCSMKADRLRQPSLCFAPCDIVEAALRRDPCLARRNVLPDEITLLARGSAKARINARSGQLLEELSPSARIGVDKGIEPALREHDRATELVRRETDTGTDRRQRLSARATTNPLAGIKVG